MAAYEDTSNYLETLYKDLALALGDAVWAFARIEWLTYEWLGRLSKDALDELVEDMTFRPRIELLCRLVNRRHASQDAKSAAVAALKVAGDLAGRRNTIVHNPWRIWVDLEARAFMTEIQKYGSSERKVDLVQLRTFTDECGRVEATLKEALNAL
jgi:hypothetical protein